VRGTLPSTYTIIAHILDTNQLINSQNAGVYLRESSSGKISGLELLTQASGGQHLRVERMNSVTSDNTTVTTYSNQLITPQSVISVKIVEDGTHRTWYTSFDRGVNWLQILQESTGAFFSPDQAGFGGISVCNNASCYVDSTLLSWSGI